MNKQKGILLVVIKLLCAVYLFIYLLLKFINFLNYDTKQYSIDITFTTIPLFINLFAIALLKC